MSWNEDRVAELRRLWGRGSTAAVIARRLGVSRDAVLGKVRRLGLGRPSHARRRSPRTRDAGGIIDMPHPASVPEARAALVALEADQCRWPLAIITGQDFGFCGRPVKAGKPYCVFHCERAYRPKPEEKT